MHCTKMKNKKNPQTHSSYLFKNFAFFDTVCESDLTNFDYCHACVTHGLKVQ